MKKIVLTVLLALLTATGMFAQQTKREIPEDTTATKTYKPFDFNLQVKTMHLWKGLRVTDAPMTAADIHYTTRNGNFKAGVWGGYGINGDYTEFDYYLSYTLNQWSLSVWDINNFSDYPDAKIFDYKKGSTSHFVDVTLAYQFKPIPLKLSWSTIVLGRDFYTNDAGELKQAFSNYVEASYTFLQKQDWSLGAFVGGVFSFTNEANFYGDHTNFTNIGFVYNKNVKVLKDYSLPFSATAMWNPEKDYGALQVAVNLF
ncbi:hypothetical protein ACG2LH_17925 [Zhouia sp. PK063]|uniref:hypothetical protein n=1 Tax=Zhouia sp. PK063 TaxID=3373602 RepID=UPI0037B7C55E